MSRPQSQAVGGFFPTPPRVVDLAAALLRPSRMRLMARARGYDAPRGAFTLLDPCAGDGAAAVRLARLLTRDAPVGAADKVLCCELEATRAEALKNRQWSEECKPFRLEPHHGDAFSLRWDLKASYGERHAGATLLWLNPPYDTDPEHGRLEQRYLARFTRALAPGGVLCFLVPHYALAASARALATEYEGLTCWRFPDPEYAAYKQVLVLAVRRRVALFEPDAELLRRVLALAETPPPRVLGDSPPAAAAYELPDVDHPGFAKLEVAQLDLVGLLARAGGWQQTDRNGRARDIPGYLPDQPLARVLDRRYPLALPPKPGHVAAAVAAGVFNGARVEPDDPASGLSPLLVKGVFNKEFRVVEVKCDKEGDAVGEVQVEQPRLVVTVLDLSARKYYTLRPSADVTGTADVAQMTTADLVRSYGRALMGVMREHCPVLHDPAVHAPLPEVLSHPEYRLYPAQAHAVAAAIKVLALPGRACWLLAEVGGGKTPMSAAAWTRLGARSVAVMCPPHLTAEWEAQVRAWLPAAHVKVLGDVADVDEWATLAGQEGVRVGIISREAAKLGHGWAAVGPLGKRLAPACPRCGAALPPGDLAKRRARCEARERLPANVAARRARQLAEQLAAAFPDDPVLVQCLGGPRAERLCARLWSRSAGVPGGLPGARPNDEGGLGAPGDGEALAGLLDAPEGDPEAGGDGRPPGGVAEGRVRVDRRAATVGRLRATGYFGRLARGLAAAVARDIALHALYGGALTAACALQLDAVVTIECVGRLLAGADREVSWGPPHEVRQLALRLALLLPRAEWPRVDALVAAAEPTALSYGSGTLAALWESTRAVLDPATAEKDREYHAREFAPVDGAPTWRKRALGDPRHARTLLHEVAAAAQWGEGQECGEPLYQAVPEPRRYPLATYVARRHKRLFDFVVWDESQELASTDSAQGHAARRLAGMNDAPVLVLSGSINNGYAESLFATQWALDPDFREEFGRKDKNDFIERYGYVKRYVAYGKESGAPVEKGSVTDRVERDGSRKVGQAPGVLPLFLLKYLLKRAVVLHKPDLALDLPPVTECLVRVDAGADLRGEERSLSEPLRAQIRADMFDKERSGKLWGALADLPSFLDRAAEDCGNQPDGSYQCRYPASAGGGLVAGPAKRRPADELLPKEVWLIDVLRAELAEGRNAIVFGWHERVLPRLARLVERELGEPVALLLAGKVQAKNRRAWINRELVGKGRRVLVVNPVAVQTGLNNLVHCSTAVFMQNPACNPLVARQAVGRVDRPGKRLPTRVYWPVYEGTLQEALHQLLLRKVAVSVAVDGLSAESALAAAGVGEAGAYDVHSVGRQLFEVLEREGAPAAPARRLTFAERRALLAARQEAAE